VCVYMRREMSDKNAMFNDEKCVYLESSRLAKKKLFYVIFNLM